MPKSTKQAARPVLGASHHPHLLPPSADGSEIATRRPSAPYAIVACRARRPPARTSSFRRDRGPGVRARHWTRASVVLDPRGAGPPPPARIDPGSHDDIGGSMDVHVRGAIQATMPEVERREP